MLLAANAELRVRLEEAEETLRAIRSGDVDALVVEGPAGSQVFTLQGVDAQSNQFRGEILAQISDDLLDIQPGFTQKLIGEQHVSLHRGQRINRLRAFHRNL